jgi:hypothetical protein
MVKHIRVVLPNGELPQHVLVIEMTCGYVPTNE